MKRKCLILAVLIVVSACFFQITCGELAAAAKQNNPETATPRQAAGSEKNTITAKSVKGPEITFESVVCNLGNIDPGSNNIGEFKFTNTGSSTLKITDVTKTCGCTPFTLEKTEYEPGESGTLKVEYHAGRQPDSINKTLFVSSNDQAKPRIELNVKANIVTKVNYEPKKLELFLNKENAGCPEIKLKSIDGKLFSIQKFEATGRTKSTKDVITADYDSSAKDAEFVIQPKVDVKKLQGEMSGHIQLIVTYPENNVITIPYDTVPRFKINPPSIIIYKADLEKPVNRDIWILSNYDEDFEIESTSSQEGAIKVLSQEKLENRYKFVLEITPPAPEKGRKGFFTDTFFVNIKGGEQLKVTCRMFYMRKTEKSTPAKEKVVPQPAM